MTKPKPQTILGPNGDIIGRIEERLGIMFDAFDKVGVFLGAFFTRDEALTSIIERSKDETPRNTLQ